MKKHHTASISMQKIETESGQESLGHSSIYLLLYLCDMKVKNIDSDIHSVSLAQGGASKCCRTFSLFITIFVIRAVWLWDTLQAWEGYAISRHSTKSLHGALMNASIFFLQGFLSLTPDNKPLKFSAPEWYTTEGILWTASFSTDWN